MSEIRKTLFRIMAVVLYTFSAGLFGYYLSLEVPIIDCSPVGIVFLFSLGCAGIYCGSLLISKTVSEKSGKRLMTISFGFFFALYLVLLLALTLFDRLYGVPLSRLFSWDAADLNDYIKNSFNLIPFKTITRYIQGFYTGDYSTYVFCTNLLGNLLAFMPFAFFLPFLFTQINNRKRFLSRMIILVAVIELIQFALRIGSCDIDDVILNVGGAWLLYEILQSSKIQRIIKKITLR